MQKHDFIRVKYSGKLKEVDKVLDQNDDAPIIVGAGHVLKGVDEALLEMNVGEKKTVEIPPEKGFGPRSPKFIKKTTVAEFKKHGQKPIPGMIVNADNLKGRILTVSGGRVQIDFNHPLAGKTLLYDLEILKKVDDEKEKVKSLLEFYTRQKPEKVEVKIKEKEIDITMPPLMNSVYKRKIAFEIMKFLDKEKVKFSEVFEKPKEEPKKEEPKEEEAQKEEETKEEPKEVKEEK